MGGVVAVAAAWLLAEIAYRLDTVPFAAAVVSLAMPMLGVGFPGADIGVSLPPLLPTLAIGLAGAILYMSRLVRLAPATESTQETVTEMWRTAGTSDETVEEMALELSDLAESRAAVGRPLSTDELTDPGMIVDWPDAADPRRWLRLLIRAVAAGVAVTAVMVLVSALGSVDGTGELDVTSLRIGASIAALVAIPVSPLVRNGRWRLVGVPIAHVGASFQAPGDLALTAESLPIAAVALVVTLPLLADRLPKMSEILDRLL
jgi:hypothetical protein